VSTPPLAALRPDALSDALSDARPDGRRLRGERTRSSIVAALLALLDDGVPAPTAAQIAERASVSVRSVFQHFSDMEALYEDLAAAQRDRVAPLIASVERPEGLDERIVALVSGRAELFETITPVRHAVAGRAGRSPALRSRLAELASALHTQLAEQFSPELSAMPARRRAEVLSLVDLLCSFEAWDRLRVVQGMERNAAERSLRTALRALLT